MFFLRFCLFAALLPETTPGITRGFFVKTGLPAYFAAALAG
jgi:hypothetical protein